MATEPLQSLMPSAARLPDDCFERIAQLVGPASTCACACCGVTVLELHEEAALVTGRQSTWECGRAGTLRIDGGVVPPAEARASHPNLRGLLASVGLEGPVGIWDGEADASGRVLARSTRIRCMGREYENTRRYMRMSSPFTVLDHVHVACCDCAQRSAIKDKRARDGALLGAQDTRDGL